MAQVAKFFILKKMFIADRSVSACDRVKFQWRTVVSSAGVGPSFWETDAQ